MNEIIKLMEYIINRQYPPKIKKKIADIFYSTEAYFDTYKPYTLLELYHDVKHTYPTNIRSSN